MLNITVAVKLWGVQWKHKVVNIVCDNSAAVNVLQSGRGRDPFLLSYAREIWYWSALHDFEIRVSHAPGLAMSWVDALSGAHLRPLSSPHQPQNNGPTLRLPVDSYLFKLRADL